jgi:hypothetical protein
VRLRDVEEHRRAASDLVDPGVFVDGVGVLADVERALGAVVVQLHLQLLIGIQHRRRRLRARHRQPRDRAGHENDRGTESDQQ